MTSDFENQIKTEKIPQPTHRKFTRKKWRQGFESLDNATERDTALYEAGKWIFYRLERIRQEVMKIEFSLPKDKLIRLHVGYINRTDNVLRAKMRLESVPGENTIFGEQLVQSKVSGNLLGIEATPDDLLASCIDGARFPLASSLLSDAERESKDEIDPLRVIGNEQKIMLLGQYYISLEETWRQILWNGYFMENKAEGILIRPPNDIYPKARAVSDYRRLSLLQQGVITAVHIWRTQLNASMKEELSLQPIINIEGSGKKRKVTVRIDKTVKSVPPSPFVARIMAQEEYLESLLTMELPVVSGVNVQLLLNCWEVIGAYVRTLSDKFPDDKGVCAIGTLFHYAPSILRKDLLGLLVDVCDVDYKKADSIVSFLTFDPTEPSDLWSCPLISLDDKLLPIVSPILSANLLMNIERWLKRGGIDLSKRGTTFETEVRKSITNYIKGNTLFQNSGCHHDCIKLGDNKEEIDLILFIKNKILVGEIKCSLYPTDPIDYYHLFQTFEYASEQAKRKAKKVIDCFSEVKNKIKGIDHLNEHDIEVIPFIVTNTTLGVGYSIDGVPIVDMLVLHKFFDGSWDKMVMFGPKGTKDVGETVTFYSTEDEAANYIKEYLESPPQINIYKKFIKPEYFPHITFDDGEQKVISGCLTVEFPLPDIYSD